MDYLSFTVASSTISHYFLQNIYIFCLVKTFICDVLFTVYDTDCYINSYWDRVYHGSQNDVRLKFKII